MKSLKQHITEKLRTLALLAKCVTDCKSAYTLTQAIDDLDLQDTVHVAFNEFDGKLSLEVRADAAADFDYAKAYIEAVLEKVGCGHGEIQNLM